MVKLSAHQLRRALEASLSVQRWVDDVVAAAPFASPDELLRVAAAAATPLTAAEIHEALAHHPRIGDGAVGASRTQRIGRRELTSPDGDDPTLAAAIAASTAEYEERFGRVFLIRAAGRTRAEILAELRRRIALDDEAELAIVAAQLREITLLRLDALLRDPRAQEAR